jgi:arginyl-tRNA synthetase
MDPVGALHTAIQDAATELRGDGLADVPRLERPPKPDFGDYSTNAAMLLAPELGEPPRTIAERLGETLGERLGAAVDRVEVAGPGFLNLFMADDWYVRALAGGLEAGDRYGAGAPEPAERVLVEFVSANPTGPISVASGRHAAYGDSLCRVLELAGHSVDREYYVNDHGTQVRLFGESIRARARGEEPPEGGYRGDYVKELASRIEGAADGDPDELARQGIELMLDQVRATLARFRVGMDRYVHESWLHESGLVEKARDDLEKGEHVYQQEGAVWLRTTTLGDDKDRVLIRSGGEVTYFGADLGYFEDKLERGYDQTIEVLGADHHGYVRRKQAGWRMLGGREDAFEILIMQLVNLMEGGRRAQMSKREGTIVPLDELIDDIGVDAARYFLLQRSHDTTIDLDLELARRHSEDNPVYYLQYAHARIASILRKAGRDTRPASPEGTGEAAEPQIAEQLHPSERALVKKLLEFPAEVQEAADRRAPHRIAVYLHEASQDFSAFYRDCKVIGHPNEEFRIGLCLITKRVLARGLDLLGVEAPDEM